MTVLFSKQIGAIAVPHDTETCTFAAGEHVLDVQQLSAPTMNPNKVLAVHLALHT